MAGHAACSVVAAPGLHFQAPQSGANDAALCAKRPQDLAIKLRTEGKEYKPQKYKRKLYIESGAGKARRERKKEKNEHKSRVWVSALAEGSRKQWLASVAGMTAIIRCLLDVHKCLSVGLRPGTGGKACLLTPSVPPACRHTLRAVLNLTYRLHQSGVCSKNDPEHTLISFTLPLMLHAGRGAAHLLEAARR